MRVHARAVVHEERFRHERDGLARFPRGVLDDVLVLEDVVRGLQERPVAHVDLGLAGRADLVVMDLDVDPDLLQVDHHLAAEVLVLVHGGQGEVALLVARPVPQVLATHLGARVPDPFGGVHVVVALVLVLVEPDRVEDVELGLGTPVADVRDARLLQVELGLAGHVARVTAVHLARDRVLHEAVDVQRGVLRERIHVRGVRVGHQQHVRFLDLLEPADRRPVEPDPIFEDRVGELVRRYREVLHQPWEVTEAEIDDRRVVLLHHGQDVLGCRHVPIPLAARRCTQPRGGSRRSGVGRVNSA